MIALVWCFAQGEFFVSPSGDDADPGTKEKPWKTVARVNRTDFPPGSVIHFEGGQKFEGGVWLDAKDSGATLTSYGEGRATIAAGEGESGIRMKNCRGMSVRNINLVGRGTNAGIRVFTDLAGAKLEKIRIDEVEVSGFGEHGITLDGKNGKSGFRDVRITRALVHDNVLSGIHSSGEFDAESKTWAHQDVTVARCVVYNHPGKAGQKNHSGSGIVMGDVDGLLIEHCEAYNNGERCDFPGGGPIGIWAWDSNRVVIQFNASHHNRTGAKSIDGGGFDLDGGVTNSVMQYNTSHDNDGAGYLLAQFEGARPFRGNTVRYNVSKNDGRAHGYAGIQAWSEKPGELADAEIYHNTVIADTAVRIQGKVKNIFFRNNLFASGALRADERDNGAVFQGNAYPKKPAIAWGGETFDTLAAWRSIGQERLDGADVGLAIDPRISDEYRPGRESPVIGAALDLRTFKIDAGPRDFRGTALQPDRRRSIGAVE